MNTMARNTTDKLLRKYVPEAIRSGFLRWWLRRNPAAESHLASDGQAREVLDACDARQATEVEEYLSGINAKATLKDVEAAFERLIDAGRRKEQGAIYTPDHIIDYLITEACGSTRSHISKFLDPACGSGGFLIRAAAHLAFRNEVSIKQSLLENVAGVDNDPDALKHAQCLVELFAAQRSETVTKQDMVILCLDSLLTPPEKLLDAIGAPDGVQVLATNPPYVKLQNLDNNYREELARCYSEFVQFNFGLSILFIIAGHRLLAPDGTLAYITQNNLFTSFAGEQVRRALQDKRSIRRIVDFGHHRVFRGVLAYTCLVFLDCGHHDAIEFERVEKDASLQELRKLDFGFVPLKSLSPKKWRLAKPTHMRNLHKIESVGTPLGTLADIRVGFATLKDKVFLVDDGGSQCRATHPKTGQEYEIEKSITRPAIRVADIREQDRLDSVTRKIIFPYRHQNGIFVLIPEDELRAQYPGTYEYLSACRKLLESRDKGMRSYEAWYAWGRTQGRDAPGPKLLTKTFNTRPQFFVDPTDTLFCNGYAVFTPQSGLFGMGVRLEVLKLILESRVMHYYMKLTSFQIDGNYQCYQKNFIERFSIPNLPEALQEEVISSSSSEADTIIANLYGLSTGTLDEVVGSIH